jgi:hypothetical protein
MTWPFWSTKLASNRNVRHVVATHAPTWGVFSLVGPLAKHVRRPRHGANVATCRQRAPRLLIFGGNNGSLSQVGRLKTNNERNSP